MQKLLIDLLACLRFYSRLPVPALASEKDPYAMLDFSGAIRMLPLAGLIIAACSAVVLILAAELGLPANVSAALALASDVLATGAFHEDGLADTADGFGGGASVEAKLAIMRDSRIGTYGGVALVLSLLIRWSALAALVQHDLGSAALAILVSGALTRTFALLPLAMLAPARSDGAAYAAMQPTRSALVVAFILAVAIGLLPVAHGVSLLHTLFAILAALAAALAMTGIAKSQISGATGDVAGATQQVAEMAYLCAFVARV